MNENDYYKWVNEVNIEYNKNLIRQKRIQYLKDNLLAIIDLVLSAIAIIISIIALCS